jgi:hypothetical protein
MGVMQNHTHRYPRKMIQTPGVIVILNEGQRRRAADLYRLPAFAQGPTAVVVWLTPADGTVTLCLSNRLP